MRMMEKKDVNASTLPPGTSHVMHRMRTPVTPTDYRVQQNGGNFLQALNCTGLNNCGGGAPCDDDCRQACCTSVGISVFFVVQNMKKFYDAHLYLYSRALEVFAIECIFNDLSAGYHQSGNVVSETFVRGLAMQDFAIQFKTNNIIDVDGAINLLKAKGKTLPECAIRDEPPAGMRVYVVDKHQQQHCHGLLQPVHGCNMDIAECDDVATARGIGWLRCPYFTRAAANPNDIASFELDPPSDPIVGVMVSALEHLVGTRLSGMATNQIDRSDDVWQLSMFIVNLCENPAPVANDSVRLTVVVPALALFLLEAVQSGLIDVMRHSKIITLIANSLSLDANDVYNMDPHVPTVWKDFE